MLAVLEWASQAHTPTLVYAYMCVVQDEHQRMKQKQLKLAEKQKANTKAATDAAEKAGELQQEAKEFRDSITEFGKPFPGKGFFPSILHACHLPLLVLKKMHAVQRTSHAPAPSSKSKAASHGEEGRASKSKSSTSDQSKSSQVQHLPNTEAIVEFEGYLIRTVAAHEYNPRDRCP